MRGLLGVLRAPHRLRWAAVLCAAVLGVGWGTDAYTHRECAHHDLPVAAAFGHGHHDAPAQGGEEHAEPCTCIDACGTHGGTPLPATVETPRPAFGREASEGDLHPAPAPARTRIPYLLPFSTAPPALL